MTGHTECGDDILVGYMALAEFADGTVDRAAIYEPKATTPDGIRALTKYFGWRSMYEAIGARVSFECVWLPRAEAVRQGFITGA